MKKRLGFPLLCLAICLLLCACQARDPSAKEILSSLTDRANNLPSGVVYWSGAEEGSEAYLPPSLLSAMYGESAEETLCLTEDYAIYLSSRAFPAEIAVFRCYSASDTDRLAALCLNRRDTLRVALRGTAWEESTDSIFVLCQGRFVIMGFTEGGKSLQKEALRLIG